MIKAELCCSKMQRGCKGEVAKQVLVGTSMRPDGRVIAAEQEEGEEEGEVWCSGEQY